MSENKTSAFNFSGPLVSSGREYVGDSRELVVPGGPFLPLISCFQQNQNNDESETNL